MERYLTKGQIKKIQSLELNLRNSITSIAEYVIGLEEILKTLNIKITFREYPHTYLEIRNTHSAPIGYLTNWHRDPALPTSYPGYSGTWNGTIELLDGTDDYVTFGHIDEIIPTINLGSGCPGSDFRISGNLWAYDFPKIKEMIDSDIEQEIERVSNRAVDLIKSYEQNYEKACKVTIDSDEELNELNDMHKKITSLLTDLDRAIIEKRESIREEFNKTYKVPLPKQNSPFVGLKAMHDLQSRLSHREVIVHPNCDKLYKEIIKITKQMLSIKNKYPEYFI